MRHVLDGMITAFSMYTILPVPPAKWDRDGMRYALCFFPLVGMVIMVFALVWQYLTLRYAISAGLFAAVATLLPILLSGGIHMDGFLDTVDALSSHAAQDRKLEILSDPHIGAFGVLGCGAYLLLTFGLWFQCLEAPRLMMLPAAGHVLSRCLNGLGIATFPCARTSGLVYLFSGGASRRAASLTCLACGLCAALFLLWVDPLWGGVAAAVNIVYFIGHRRFCLRGFGGNTGDLSGFLTQNVEILTLAVAAIGGICS